MYVPADLLKAALDDGSLNTGPRRGFEITHENLRSIDRATFVGLVRNAMIGTTEEQTAEIHETLRHLAVDREPILAVRQRVRP
jgi:hypothetical protein